MILCLSRFADASQPLLHSIHVVPFFGSWQRSRNVNRCSGRVRLVYGQRTQASYVTVQGLCLDSFAMT